jgi:hypothetical protein
MEQTARSAVMVNERLSFEENRTQKSGGAAGDRQRMVELAHQDASEGARLHRRRENRSKNRR